MLMHNRTDHRSLILSPARCLLVYKFGLLFVFTNVRDAIDDGPYPFARQVRAECEHGAYHETFEVHLEMILHVREVPHGPVGVHIRVTLVSSTVDATEGIFFVEGVH